MNLVPVSESPLNKNTAYKYHSLRKYPALILKIAGRLYVDLNEWERMGMQVRKAQIKESERIWGPVEA